MTSSTLNSESTNQFSTFEKDILEGLEATQKKLSSKYFYDEDGSKIFQIIMNLPEYYLTRCEYEIFESYKENLYEQFSKGTQTFNLIELGAGDGLKTQVLLSNFVNQNTPFSYLPIDISGEALHQLKVRFNKTIPSLNFEGLEGEYFEALAQLKTKNNLSEKKNTRNIVLFLGSNIGNFGDQQSLNFLTKLAQNLNQDDYLLLGFDLKKHPKIIKMAYNDANGITKAFNLNLLKRINRELDGNFNIEKFDFYSTYVPETGEVRSYIVSEAKQEVSLKKLNKTIKFEWGETIHTEISRKYSANQMKEITKEAGFEFVESYTDCKGYFMDMLLRVK
ncbi:putative methyltransferase [Bernardetia litoralis DSM 6794]|uniref:Putative methyltransferase n=1 Tax=Bernardetia litoralis (strain ATCC 23117 / DSM 6794 / NBRC 15988 / NCIMB 1366 / Fx l1 / Sio-4) TaxID=880071 RepID=I4AIM6_BERLS|nr:L-histidine N(alpha)-methyltransferase [Bernardetia litoralis]AFM03811.1 putative methyltransferase [Bernardetia litoralis DSM 6794]